MPPCKRLPDGRDIAALRPDDGTSRWIRSGARFECSKCGWTTPLEPEMKRHYRSRCAADSELLPCNLETCKERYLTLDDVSLHEINARHDASWFENWTSLEGDKAQCKICGKERPFNRRKQHEFTHQAPARIECPLCDHMFFTDCQLRQHNLVCHREAETCSNPLCDYTTTTKDMQIHRSRNNHLINEVLVSIQRPLSDSISPTEAPASSVYKEYMNEVNSYFDMLEEKGLVRKHPRNWPKSAEVGERDGAESRAARHAAFLDSFYQACGLVEWKQLALKKVGYLDVYHLNHMTAALFAGNSSEDNPREQFLQWKHDMLPGHREFDVIDADPIDADPIDADPITEGQDDAESAQATYNNPQFAKQFVTVQHRFCQAMQWQIERFHLWMARHGFFPHLSDPRAILFLVMLTQEVHKTYTSKTDNQIHSLMHLSQLWSSRQFMKGKKATVSFPVAVEAVRVRHLPGSTTQEVERILAQPLDVAQSKKFGSHAHTIPKTKDMWNTFVAELEKAGFEEKGNRLEDWKAKGSLLLLKTQSYVSEMSSAPHLHRTHWTIEEHQKLIDLLMTSGIDPRTDKPSNNWCHDAAQHFDRGYAAVQNQFRRPWLFKIQEMYERMAPSGSRKRARDESGDAGGSSPNKRV